jgi:hypothetical protein
MSIKEKAKSAREVFEGDKSLNKTYTSIRSLHDEPEAKVAFDGARQRMMDVNSWGRIPGPENAEFQLYDSQGPKSDAPEVGDFIKTMLPGPFPENWVQIIDIQEDPDRVSFSVRPCQGPDKTPRSVAQTKHFFKSSASSTFILQRKGNVLKASEVGFNESINNQGPEAGNRKVLNTIISEAGWALVQKLQWENVTDYIVGKKHSRDD